MFVPHFGDDFVLFVDDTTLFLVIGTQLLGLRIDFAELLSGLFEIAAVRGAIGLEVSNLCTLTADCLFLSLKRLLEPFSILDSLLYLSQMDLQNGCSRISFQPPQLLSRGFRVGVGSGLMA
jgi:hypothetical protein